MMMMMVGLFQTFPSTGAMAASTRVSSSSISTDQRRQLAVGAAAAAVLSVGGLALYRWWHKKPANEPRAVPVPSSTPLSSVKPPSASNKPIFGGIEAGGTTWVLTISEDTPTNITQRFQYPTTSPDETLGTARKWFEGKNITALGIASFGPVDLDTKSKTYGYVTATPKKGWEQTNVYGVFQSLGVPIGFTTDVNAAAIAELKWGQHGDVPSCCYITVGTGIGVGVAVNNQPLVGLTHPEGGHIRVNRHPDDKYKGNCRYHKDCVEGLANSEAIAARAGVPAADLIKLPDDHPCLYPLIRTRMVQDLNGYVPIKKVTDHTDAYVVRSVHGADSGAVGSLELARLALEAANK